MFPVGEEILVIVRCDWEALVKLDQHMEGRRYATKSDGNVLSLGYAVQVVDANHYFGKLVDNPNSKTQFFMPWHAVLGIMRIPDIRNRVGFVST